jgi:alpha-galactosidase
MGAVSGNPIPGGLELAGSARSTLAGVPRIVVLGAGSVEFTRNIVADLCSFLELHGGLTLALHDIDDERLTYATRAADSIVQRTGAGFRVEGRADRRAALDGGDYVINEIQVGGYRATLTDFEIPKKYGLRQTIGDTIGAGGIFRGLRTIPVMVGIGNDMAELCPDALLLNYTNPMAMVPWGVYAGTPFHNVVGVCHSVRDTHAFLARTVGLPQERVAFRTAGLNHQAFVLEFRERTTGRDLYPRLREVVEADPQGLGRRVRVEMFRRLGYFPTESSEHSSEYVPWFLPHTTRWSGSASRWTSTSGEARRTSPSGSARRTAWTPGRSSRLSPPRSSPRRSSTPSRPEPRARSTRTCATAD